MKIIKPSEISAKIMTLIDEAEERVILVSPYVKVSKWYKMKNKLENLVKSNTDLEIYIREGNDNKESYNEIVSLGIEPILIPNLHCKLYLSEKYAVVTSMNLLFSSEVNALEIGYETEIENEVQDLIDYYEKNIEVYNKQSSFSIQTTAMNRDWRDFIVESLSKMTVRKVSAFQDDNKLIFKTGINTYSCFIANIGNKNFLRISGILSEKEFEKCTGLQNKIADEINMKIELFGAKNGYYSTIWGQGLNDLKSFEINNLFEKDKDNVIKSILDFISKIDSIKVSSR